MRWIYLSPHFDDVVLSCGGLVWEQVRAGQDVQVWTVCAGWPAPGTALSSFALDLHQRWGTGLEAVPIRRAEDEQAIRLLGAGTRYWDLPDCIYRQLPGGNWLVNNNDDLWQPLHPAEQGIVDRLATWIGQGVAEMVSAADVRLVGPLTIGNHVDHSLVRAVAEQAARRLDTGLWYYPDYPYAADPKTKWTGKLGGDWQQACQTVSPEALAAWQESVASYASQISTFWKDRTEMNAALKDYWQSGGGSCLWRPGEHQA